MERIYHLMVQHLDLGLNILMKLLSIRDVSSYHGCLESAVNSFSCAMEDKEQHQSPLAENSDENKIRLYKGDMTVAKENSNSPRVNTRP